MLLREIINLTIDRLDLKEDLPIEDILTTSINEAYMKLNKENPSVRVSYIPIISKIAKLPEDLIEIITTTPILCDDDKRVGNSILTDNIGVFSIVHSYYYEALEGLDDEPQIPSYLHSILSSYACYKFLQNKAPNVATVFLNEFEMAREEYNQMNKKASLGKNFIKDAYSEMGLWGEF